MTNSPAVDSLEQVVADMRAKYFRNSIEHEFADRITALTRPPGGSERLREDVGCLREQANAWIAVTDVLNEVAPDWINTSLAGIDCACNAIRRLASPQGAEPDDRATTALRDALAYVGQRTDGDLATIAERAELWMRESKSLLAAQSAEQRQEAVAYRYRHSALENWHYGDHPKSWWECQPLYATPHPAQAASQGDAAWRDAVTDACVVACINWDETDPRGSLERLIAWREEIALDPRVSERAAALSSPTGVQAAQVSDWIALADKIEARAREWGGPTFDHGIAWAKEIRALAQPGSAAHGGEVSGG